MFASVARRDGGSVVVRRGVALHRMLRPRILLLVSLALLLVAACSPSTAAPQPPAAAPAVADPVAAPAAPAATDAAASSVGPGSLDVLLTAPKFAPPTTAAVAPGETTTTTKPPDPYKTGPRPSSPVITPPPPLPPGDGTVYAVGDSVLLGANNYLPQTLGGWDLRLDAKVGRHMNEGIDLIRENRGSIGQAAVVLLGHNDGGGSSVYGQLDLIMSYLRKTQRVVFVTIKEWQPGHATTNRAIRALPKTYPNVVVADWAAVLDANPQFLVDNVHPNSAGQIALANLIAVMLGPCRRDGSTVPPLKILPIPDGVDIPKTTIPGATEPTKSATTTSSTVVVETTTTSSAPPPTTSTTSVATTTTGATTTLPPPASTTTTAPPR
jgi:hypothetical protein